LGPALLLLAIKATQVVDICLIVFHGLWVIVIFINIFHAGAAITSGSLAGWAGRSYKNG
jgi:uncharacterized membrane protein YobD (UPF0266 family)